MATRPRSAQEWLDAYGVCHTDPRNKALHWICVPAITACVLAFLTALPAPEAMRRLGVDWGVVATAAALLFYLRLSPRLAAGMAVVAGAMLAAIRWFDGAGPVPLWQAAVAIFVAAWIGQFVGHAIEGKRPSFVDDLQFLLIGPIWLLADCYRRLGWWPR